MKKILYLAILSMSATVCMSQSVTSSVPDNAKKMTVAEANALNGTAQPTINGKPYSQYKAEQDALKNKQPQQTAKSNIGSPSNAKVASDDIKADIAPQKTATPYNVPAAAAKQVEIKGTSLEVKPVTENSKPAVENKTAPSSVTPVAAQKAPVSKQNEN